VAAPQTVIWMRPEHAEAGRPAERGRAQVTAAATTAADQGGLAAATMRRVAAELGTGAAPLYRFGSWAERMIYACLECLSRTLSTRLPSCRKVVPQSLRPRSDQALDGRHRRGGDWDARRIDMTVDA
jgi:hypothetical protein